MADDAPLSMRAAQEAGRQIEQANRGSLAALLTQAIELARHEDCRTATDKQCALAAIRAIEAECERLYVRVLTTRPGNQPPRLTLQQLRPTIHPLTAPEFVRSPDEAA
jgi:methylthioribose-1-phosphate isomerase